VSLYVALAAAAAIASRGPITNAADGVTVTISRDGSAAATSATIKGVVLTVEVSNDEAAAVHGYRSLTSVVDIDCRGERDHVEQARAFKLPHLAGPSEAWPTPGVWVRPAPDAYMSQVIKAVCAREHFSPGQDLSAVVTQSDSPRRSPGLGPSVVTGQASVSESSESDPTVQARVQIASSETREGAQESLTRFAARILPPLRGEVEIAKVRGRTVYRSIVEPFPLNANALAFCAEWKRAGGDCIVWQRRGAAAN